MVCPLFSSKSRFEPCRETARASSPSARSARRSEGEMGGEKEYRDRQGTRRLFRRVGAKLFKSLLLLRKKRNSDTKGLRFLIFCGIITVYGGDIMFSFFRKKLVSEIEQQPPLELPLSNIQKIDQAGILYVDNEGTSTNINYYEAYKSWCKSKSVKKSKPKYICDRTKSDGWKITFHTNPKITFHADPSQEELWISVLNSIHLQGYSSFDFD